MNVNRVEVGNWNDRNTRAPIGSDARHTCLEDIAREQLLLDWKNKNPNRPERDFPEPSGAELERATRRLEGLNQGNPAYKNRDLILDGKGPDGKPYSLIVDIDPKTGKGHIPRDAGDGNMPLLVKEGDPKTGPNGGVEPVNHNDAVKAAGGDQKYNDYTKGMSPEKKNAFDSFIVSDVKDFSGRDQKVKDAIVNRYKEANGDRKKIGELTELVNSKAFTDKNHGLKTPELQVKALDAGAARGFGNVKALIEDKGFGKIGTYGKGDNPSAQVSGDNDAANYDGGPNATDDDDDKIQSQGRILDTYIKNEPFANQVNKLLNNPDYARKTEDQRGRMLDLMERTTHMKKYQKLPDDKKEQALYNLWGGKLLNDKFLGKKFDDQVGEIVDYLGKDKEHGAASPTLPTGVKEGSTAADAYITVTGGRDGYAKDLTGFLTKIDGFDKKSPDEQALIIKAYGSSKPEERDGLNTFLKSSGFTKLDPSMRTSLLTKCTEDPAVHTTLLKVAADSRYTGAKDKDQSEALLWMNAYTDSRFDNPENGGHGAYDTVKPDWKDKVLWDLCDGLLLTERFLNSSSDGAYAPQEKYANYDQDELYFNYWGIQPSSTGLPVPVGSDGNPVGTKIVNGKEMTEGYYTDHKNDEYNYFDK